MQVAASPSSTSTEDAARAPTADCPAAFALRVGGIPGALSDDAVTALLSHYGSTRVRILRRKKAGAMLHGSAERVVHAAIAEFASKDRLLDAQQRLARVQLAGSRLTVEVAHSAEQDTSRDGEEADRAANDPVGLPHNGATVTPTPTPEPTKAAGALHTQPPPGNAPVPLAPHLGLNYAPSPLLQYKYPKASVPIVRNIANALIALPRFYTQVLHLMNKMNLPPPFEVDAIPGRFSEAFMPAFQSHAGGGHHRQDRADQLVEEDDEEDDAVDQSVRGSSTAKRVRLNEEVTRATGKKRQRATSDATSSSSMIDDFRPPRPGVISSVELDQQRLPDAARASDPAFAGYTTGLASCRVRVDNLAESVDTKGLEYVFGHVLPPAAPLESMRIERLASSTSATLTFPTMESAEQAVLRINGVVVDGQALVVHYAENEEAMVPPGESQPQRSGPEPLPPSAAASESYERMDPKLLAQEKSMKNYQRGDPTAALYLKNLPKAMDESTLRAVCRPFLSASVSTDSLTIRHFTEGRMKNQAFIECPSQEIAAAVLEGIHGLVVHGKPLVVSFRKPSPAAPSPAQM